MNIEQLRTAGGFISAEPVQTAIQWNDNSFDVFIRKLAFGDVERLLNSEQNPSVAMIAAAVLLGDEKDPITRQDAERLDVALAAKLIEAVNLVNGAAAKN